MYKKILVPLDLEETSSWERALPVAVALCQTFKAELVLMTVVPEFGMAVVGAYFPEGYETKMRSQAAEALTKVAEAELPQGLAGELKVGHGTIYHEISRIAAEVGADLIVMASHRPELKDYLLGPNAARVVRHSPLSVLVVR
ncbi:MAG: universal stress protein [Alphaproteobacteria bacterium]